MIYFCENGAFHEYECCGYCWNMHPEAKKYPDKSFSKEFRIFANEEARQNAIKEAMKNGFTKKQATYLSRNIKASFQNVVMFSRGIGL